MPRTKTDLTPAEYAVLGLLRERPSYGYDLKDRLARGQGLGLVSPVEPAMIYAILRSLTGLELIDGTWDDSTYPRKAVYTVTDAGNAAFERWLRRPVGRIREVRHDFMVKLYFALREDPQLARDLLRAQIEVVRDYIEEAERAEEAHDAPPADFETIALASRTIAARTTLQWLEDSLAALTAKRRRRRA